MKEPEQTKRDRIARDIFLRAVELQSAEERDAYLDGACRLDGDLRLRVEALLRSDASDSFLEMPAMKTPMADATDSLPCEVSGSVIGSQNENSADPIDSLRVGPFDKLMAGRYKLLEKIGEGGMGIVYMAEQIEPVSRKVALKIIKLGMDTKQVVARFEAERQALALMDHPNIAKVFDGGVTETGRPYFVMELVQGIPITEFCDNNKLTTQKRVELFLPVCQAIQSAHQKGILHRDIKPNNVMVSYLHGEPVAKVIDFGIAKAINRKLTEKTLFTQFASMVGTPAYMSPEQAEMSVIDVDTRTDVYSLGVLLYELLTGTTPFLEERLRSAGYGEMRRIIAEEEPEKPSTRMSTLEGGLKHSVSTFRKADIETLQRRFKGDLDWITMKCLEKDRRRRYETPNELAADLRRHLESKPVLAVAPSTFYKLRKAWNRNMGVYTSVLLAFLCLVIATFFSGWQSIVATRAKNRAIEAETEKERQRQESEAARKLARRRAYASDMRLAQWSLKNYQIGRARELLDRQIPLEDEEDLRGWEWRYLWQSIQSDAKVTIAKTHHWILDMKVSQDQNGLAITQQGQGGVEWLALSSGEKKTVFAPDLQNVCMALHPLEHVIAIGGKDQSTDVIRFYEWDAGSLSKVVKLPGPCRGLIYSHDGNQLIVRVGGKINQIIVWDLRAVEPISRVLAQGRALYAYNGFGGLALSHDNQWLAFATSDGEIELIHLETKQVKWTATKPLRDQIRSLVFSPDSRWLAGAGCCSETDVLIWDAETGALAHRLKGHQAWISSLAFSADGESLYSGSADRTLRVWDMSKMSLRQTLTGHADEIWQVVIGDQAEVITGDKEGVICRWEPAQPQKPVYPILLDVGEPLSNFWRSSVRWAFEGEGESILSLNSEGSVTRYAGHLFDEVEQVLVIPHPGSPGMMRHFSADGRRLAVEYEQGKVEVWDIEQGQSSRILQTSEQALLDMKLNQTGGQLITLDLGGQLIVWDMETGLKVDSWSDPEARSVYYSTDATHVYWTRAEGGLSVRDMLTGNTISKSFPVSSVFDCAIPQDFPFLAVAVEPSRTMILEKATLGEHANMGPHLLGEKALAFAPDTRRLATASQGSETLRLWDWERGEELITLEGGPYVVREVKFSKNGNVVGVRDNHGSILLWRAPSWDSISRSEFSEKTAFR